MSQFPRQVCPQLVYSQQAHPHQSYYDSQPVQRTAEYGSPSVPQLPPANLECAGCLQRAVTSTLFALSNPGHLFRLSCGHVYCLGCLTEKLHASQHGTDHPIECLQCRTAAGFTYPPRQQQCMLAASEAYFQSIRDVNILDPDSPYYRARDLCIMDRTKFRGVLNLVYGSTRNHSQECTQLDIPSITIFQSLSKHGNEGLFVTTPELLEAELKIVFDDIIFDFLVRQRNKPYSLVVEYVFE
jgi:hypothetical protein